MAGYGTDYVERVGPERLWLASVVLVSLAIVVGALAFPQRVYVDLLWQYYWGPVVADANGWSCVAWAGGEQVHCSDAPVDGGPTATPGYTLISYAGYVPTLILLLIGVVFLLRRLELERYREAFFAFVPFVFFGGALRTVEDANVAAPETIISLPYVAALISPFIYVTVFLVAVLALVVSVTLERRGVVSQYEYALAGIGTILLAVTLGSLAYFSITIPTTFYPLLLVVVLGVSTIITALVWVAIDRFAPDLNRGTGYAGVVVIWAHTLDGVANVIGLDWYTAFGAPSNLIPKHPLNEAIVTTTGSILPASVVEITGAAWPFLLVKVAAAVVIIWIFDESIFEESPRYAYLLLLTVVAVGLGPGTRDMLRAVFGV